MFIFRVFKDGLGLLCYSAGRAQTLGEFCLVEGEQKRAFGDRFGQIAETYGAEVTGFSVEWGHAADPAAIAVTSSA